MILEPTLRIVTDEVTIIDCLVDSKEMIKDFSKNQAKAFLVGEDFHLVLYFADKNIFPRFRMFIVDDFSMHEEAMCVLINALDEEIKDGNEEMVMRIARNKVLDMLHMSGTFRALFGKTELRRQQNELFY